MRSELSRLLADEAQKLKEPATGEDSVDELENRFQRIRELFADYLIEIGPRKTG